LGYGVLSQLLAEFCWQRPEKDLVMMVVRLSMLNKTRDDEFLLGKLPGNLFGILADLLWAKPQTLFSRWVSLNAQTITSLFSPSPDHVSTIWCPHSGAKPRGSFSLAASAAQRSLHTLVLLGDFYKKSQSNILSL
jgi:hypothetical protein